jgi:hypothetical protein
MYIDIVAAEICIEELERRAENDLVAHRTRVQPSLQQALGDMADVENLTDETYIATCFERGDCWFGTRRKVALTACRW